MSVFDSELTRRIESEVSSSSQRTAACNSDIESDEDVKYDSADESDAEISNRE